MKDKIIRIILVACIFFCQVITANGYDLSNKEINLANDLKVDKIEHRLLKESRSIFAQNLYIKIPVVIIYSNNSVAKMEVSSSDLLNLAKDDGVNYIRYPRKAHPLDELDLADPYNFSSFHSSGITGRNVKVAVVDLGFKDYELVGLDKIRELKSFRNDGKLDDTIHGTLCAKIISEIAPDAELYLYAVLTDLDFVEAIEYAISRGVDVISISLGFTAAPFDGTGPLCDAVNRAASKGIVVVVSAGNFADKHYEGMFFDPDGDGWHNFARWDEILDIGHLSKGEKIEITLSWDDWPQSSNDYDLVLLYKDSSKWVPFSFSTSPQTGHEEPVEIIEEIIPFDAVWGVAIKANPNAKPLRLELYSNVKLSEYVVEGSSLTSPADAEKVLSVGAISQNYTIFEYSSRGPTNDGRVKPDYVALGKKAVSGYLFSGTSVSAPHIAGLVALMKSATYLLQPEEIKNILSNSSIDLGDPGKDNIYGYGFPIPFNVFTQLKSEEKGLTVEAPSVANKNITVRIVFEGKSEINTLLYNITTSSECVKMELKNFLDFDLNFVKTGDKFITFVGAKKDGIKLDGRTVISEVKIFVTCAIEGIWVNVTNAKINNYEFNYINNKFKFIKLYPNLDISILENFLMAFDQNNDGFVDSNEFLVVKDYLLEDEEISDFELICIINYWLEHLISDRSLIEVILIWLR